MSFEVKAWYAKHTGGTKFYHVIRVISPHDNKSFSIEHYGPKATFVGIGKAATGTITVRPGESGTQAGLKKINEKRGRGYLDEQKLEEWGVDAEGTLLNLKTWLRARLGAQAYREAARIIDANFTALKPEAAVPPAEAELAPAPAPSKGMLPADYDYGTW